MGHIGGSVLGLHRGSAGESCVDIPVVSPFAVELVGVETIAKGGPMCVHLFGVRGLAPFDLHRIGCLNGPPGVVGNHSDAACDLHDFADTAHGFGLARIKADHLPALTGVHADGGVDHVGMGDVDAKGERACGFAQNVDAFHGIADERPCGGIA